MVRISSISSIPSKLISSKRPMKGEMKVAPAFAANKAWLAAKHKVTLTILPSWLSTRQAFKPSHVRGSFTAILLANSASFRPSAIILSASVAVTSALTGPDTMPQISLVTSKISRPDFLIKDGFVVTPSTIPRSFNSIISETSAVSTKNFMT